MRSEVRNLRSEINVKIGCKLIAKAEFNDIFEMSRFLCHHSQVATLDELNKNLKEVIEMLLEDGPPKMEGEFIGTQNVMVANADVCRIEINRLRF